MILLFPIHCSVWPAKCANQTRADTRCLPAVGGFHLDPRHPVAECRQILCLVEGHERVRVVVLVHSCRNDSGYLEPFHSRRETARHRVHLPATGREQIDAVTYVLVESHREELAEHDTPT